MQQLHTFRQHKLGGPKALWPTQRMGHGPPCSAPYVGNLCFRFLPNYHTNYNICELNTHYNILLGPTLTIIPNHPNVYFLVINSTI